ncbi:type II toxin-antitoxin system RelE/ParE family toxin [Metallumcola ferriviriculae]|uniref:Type II toxin-antitoxin system RelE/ParE family toxin n=1 Tax=Metallumcola ferriviriculae TaxID=3039180 RepID=A0AAU0USY5_9FIRM|nr:type II toxin-antitoxin system RelE/ParE family toxin [Desulfitibacteraceae bacterium MK1]
MSAVNERYHVIVSERANEMLVQHTRFLAQVSTQTADKLTVDIIEAAKTLREFPERGSWLNGPLLPRDKYKKLLVDKRYLLIYKIKEDTVYIDYVVDCRQGYTWLK